MPFIAAWDFTAIARGSIARANNKGDIGQPCLQLLDSVKVLDVTLLVSICALG